ncbi:hypothetical protein G4B88_002109 [Cannabis sativa]|uniref:Leucine-rich repeat-containing N-terminal plant-type domain-containing protein n=1 Tax=Cannabis sativa TaxID=3483 RepID=A0A7J6EY61_CANSA|nr:hypothetical protein G4B88_002109 [Cannabis sativa]
MEEHDYPRWSDLLPEALALIFTKLPFRDKHSPTFSLVCKPWRKVVASPYCWQDIDFTTIFNDDLLFVDDYMINMVVKDEDAFAIASSMPRLKHLEIAYTSVTTKESERQALLTFKQGLDVHDNVLSSWNNNNKDCCSWRGIRCHNLTNHIIKLHLRPNITYDHGSFTNLKYLNLSNNHLVGNIPSQLGNLTKLRVLDLGDDYGFGTNLTIKSFNWISHLTNLRILKLGGTNLTEAKDWFSSFKTAHSLSILHLNYCQFPELDHTTTNSSTNSITTLHVSDSTFGSTTFSHLLNLSNNLIDLSLNYNNKASPVFTIPDSFENLKSLRHFNFQWNQFRGEIPKSIGSLCKLQELVLYGNEFNSTIIDILKNLIDCNNKSLEILDLSYNNLSGPLLPKDYFSKIPHLRKLDVSHNKFNVKWAESIISNLSSLELLDISVNSFTGIVIETHLEKLSKLEHLDLSSNFLTLKFETNWVPPFQLQHLGILPSSMKNCTQLLFLDIGENNMRGNIPMWIGEMLKQLVFLRLNSNHFYGTIPTSLCHLNGIRILDISHNKISGLIPSCINNFTYESSSSLTVVYAFGHFSATGFDIKTKVTWKGKEYEYQEILGLLRIIDFSSNKLIGEIPMELTNLVELLQLNLSRNNLSGVIPWNIGNLSKLEALDLSHNNFSGEIPIGLGNYLSCRKIPISTQLQSFNASSYVGNGELCGLPLLIECSSGNHATFNPHSNSDDDDDDDQEWFDMSWFYIGLEVGIALGSPLIGIIPPELGNLTKLDILDLSSVYHISRLLNLSNNLVDLSLFLDNYDHIIPHTLGSLKSLRHLHLSGFVGEVPKSIGNLCKLQELVLNYNTLNSSTITDILKSLIDCNSNSLEILNLPHNNLTGQFVPIDFGRITNLKELDVSYNKFNGKWPESISKLSSLELLDIFGNSFSGVVYETHLDKLSKLEHLDLSYNSLTMKFGNNWVPSFQLQHLGLRSCMIGPHFPSWLQTQSNISHIDLSYSGISDTIPTWCFNTISSLRYLNLSFNQIEGTLPNILLPSNHSPVVDLSSNKFHGHIPLNSLFNATILKLSNNTLKGFDPLFCNSLLDHGTLKILDLSNNQLFGNLPDCWFRLQNLIFLNLHNNRLFGVIPNSISSLYQIQFLDLRKNNFSGTLPSSMKNCTHLIFLDVGENNLEGTIPMWIGETLTTLLILQLKSNNFHGSIPSTLCHLQPIQILIFPCMELTNLVGLVQLNLSRNNLSGGIPENIGNLSKLEALDFSHNSVSGNIPTGTQLQSFDASSYVGNDKLCGLPILTKCPGDHNPILKEDDPHDSNFDDQRWFDMSWFYVGLEVGIALGFMEFVELCIETHSYWMLACVWGVLINLEIGFMW